MSGKPTGNPMMGFLLRFICIFGVLIAPWPGWNNFYSDYFREAAQVALNFGEVKRVIVLDANPKQTVAQDIDSRMTMGNRDLLDADGKGRLMRTGLNTRSLGWVPTALTMTLILATPISWRRRALALLGGLGLIHLFILFSLLSWVWNHSPDLSLLNLSPFWKNAADELNYLFLNQLGVSFSIPILIWVLVAFRREDGERLDFTAEARQRPDHRDQTAVNAGSALVQFFATKKQQCHARSDDAREVFSSGLGNGSGVSATRTGGA